MIKQLEMKSRIFLCAALGSVMGLGQEQEASVQDSSSIQLETIEIIQKLPLTSERITQSKLDEKNLGQDLTQLLQGATSLVSTSDAGAGVGYSSLRIRGVGQDHINVSMNGVALNDPESQTLFWVNMPDLASQTSSVSIQRGVGTSTSGSAFTR